jgi:hypothetical protein
MISGLMGHSLILASVAGCTRPASDVIDSALGCATLDSRRLMPVAIVVFPNDLTKLPAELPHLRDRHLTEHGKLLRRGTA